MSVNLQYNYAGIELATGRCHTVGTFSYEINNSAWISLPVYSDEYKNKYYNINGDQLWYWDTEFTQLWEECPSHNA